MLFPKTRTLATRPSVDNASRSISRPVRRRGNVVCSCHAKIQVKSGSYACFAREIDCKQLKPFFLFVKLVRLVKLEILSIIHRNGTRVPLLSSVQRNITLTRTAPPNTYIGWKPEIYPNTKLIFRRWAFEIFILFYIACDSKSLFVSAFLLIYLTCVCMSRFINSFGCLHEKNYSIATAPLVMGLQFGSGNQDALKMVVCLFHNRSRMCVIDLYWIVHSWSYHLVL